MSRNLLLCALLAISLSGYTKICFGQSGPPNSINRKPSCFGTNCFDFEVVNGWTVLTSCSNHYQSTSPFQDVVCPSNAGCLNETECNGPRTHGVDYNQPDWNKTAEKLKCNPDSLNSPVETDTWFCKRTIPCECVFVDGQPICGSVPTNFWLDSYMQKWRLDQTLCALFEPPSY